MRVKKTGAALGCGSVFYNYWGIKKNKQQQGEREKERNKTTTTRKSKTIERERSRYKAERSCFDTSDQEIRRRGLLLVFISWLHFLVSQYGPFGHFFSSVCALSKRRYKSRSEIKISKQSPPPLLSLSFRRKKNRTRQLILQTFRDLNKWFSSFSKKKQKI